MAGEINTSGRQFSFRIPREIDRWLTIYAHDNDTSKQAVLLAALAAYRDAVDPKPSTVDETRDRLGWER